MYRIAPLSRVLYDHGAVSFHLKFEDESKKKNILKRRQQIKKWLFGFQIFFSIYRSSISNTLPGDIINFEYLLLWEILESITIPIHIENSSAMPNVYFAYVQHMFGKSSTIFFFRFMWTYYRHREWLKWETQTKLWNANELWNFSVLVLRTLKTSRENVRIINFNVNAETSIWVL